MEKSVPHSIVPLKRSFSEVNNDNEENNPLKRRINVLPQYSQSLTADSSSILPSSPTSPSVLLSLPLELWKLICKLLPQRDLKSLRKTCRWFRTKVITPPLWKQWVPYYKLDKHKMKCQRLGLDTTVYGCSFSKRDTISLNSLQKLPHTVKELDLASCSGTLTEENFHNFPPSITRVVFPWHWDKTILKNGMILLYHKFPHILIELEENLGLFNSLYWASFNGYKDVVHTILLIDKTNINQPNGSNGVTPLFSAACNGFKEIVDILLQHGADPNIAILQTKDTPLMIAACYGYLDIVKALLHVGANPFFKDKEGQLPISYAEKSGYHQVVDVLKQAMDEKTAIIQIE